MIAFLFVVCCVAVPLAIWKLVEVLIWFFSNLSWGV